MATFPQVEPLPPGSVQDLLLWRQVVRKYPAIREAIKFSLEAILRLRHALREGLEAPEPHSPCIVVSGSLARLEGSSQSDLDFMIIYPGGVPETAGDFRQSVNKIISSVKQPFDHGERTFGRPNPKGVFAKDIRGPDLRDMIGSREEDYSNIAQRMLLLLESQPLWNEAYFSNLRNELLDGYSKDVALDSSKHFVLLINDLIRYFRSICVNYHADKTSEYGKWPIRNIKLRHSRIIMYASLLFTIGELSKLEYAKAGLGGKGDLKVETLKRYVSWPPLERFVRLYEANEDDNIFRLLSPYAVFLERMGHPETREELMNLEYEDRYQLPAFAALKANSDAFASELTRFLTARRGRWSDRFFEYILL